VEEFWKSAAFRGKMNLHVDVIRAKNGHHAAEAVFKSAARALKQAIERVGTGILSTKGSLTA
jgi:imidazoleglycerol-phosphate dehydratase